MSELNKMPGSEQLEISYIDQDGYGKAKNVNKDNNEISTIYVHLADMERRISELEDCNCRRKKNKEKFVTGLREIKADIKKIMEEK